MGSIDFAYEYLDWWHDDIGEGFEHSGLLNSFVLNPALTIGLSDYVNLTIAQTIGTRVMDYKGENTTPHHRDEGTESDFDNVIGGYLGDTRLLLRYLILNDGMQGNRLFLGTGLSIPSSNRITISPYLHTTYECSDVDISGEEENSDICTGKTIGDEVKIFPEHRHFSMSDGSYQWMGEFQFFRKLTPPIIFWGISSSISYPIKESKEGFLSPTRVDVSLTLLTQKIKYIDAALGFYMQYKYSSYAKWNGIKAPNSKGTTFTPGFGLIWTTKSKLGIAMNFLFPQLISGRLAQIDSEVDQDLTAWQITFGLRKTFNYSIPFLE